MTPDQLTSEYCAHATLALQTIDIVDALDTIARRAPVHANRVLSDQNAIRFSRKLQNMAAPRLAGFLA